MILASIRNIYVKLKYLPCTTDNFDGHDCNLSMLDLCTHTRILGCQQTTIQVSRLTMIAYEK